MKRLLVYLLHKMGPPNWRRIWRENGWTRYLKRTRPGTRRLLKDAHAVFFNDARKGRVNNLGVWHSRPDQCVVDRSKKQHIKRE
jgi:hypothetical protein